MLHCIKVFLTKPSTAAEEGGSFDEKWSVLTGFWDVA